VLREGAPSGPTKLFEYRHKRVEAVTACLATAFLQFAPKGLVEDMLLLGDTVTSIHESITVESLHGW
jgi:hypothetical protein